MSASYDAYNIFYYVGKYGNITRAASALFLSQSTVSRAIQSLEAELCCRLFERNQNGVTLTAEGAALFSHVEQAHDQIADGEKAIRQMQFRRTDGLRIGVTEFTFTQYLLPILPEFCRAFPETRLEFCTQKALNDDAVFRALTDGKLDLLCTITPSVGIAECSVSLLTEFSDAIVAGEAFRPLLAQTTELSDLQRYPLVSYTCFGSACDELAQSLPLPGAAVFPKFRVDSGTYLVHLVRAGLCLAMVPEPMLPSLGADGGIFRVPLRTALPKRFACIATAKDRPLSAAGTGLVGMLRQYVAALPAGE